MRFKTENSGDFQLLFNAIAILVDEITFHFTAEGIHARTMDPSRVAMVDFTLSSSFFDEYECDEPTDICVNMDELMKLLRRAGDAPTEFRLEDSKRRIGDHAIGDLSITFLEKNAKREFRFPMLEPVEDVPTPKVTFTARAKLVAATWLSAVEDANLVSDYTRVILDKTLVLDAKGDLLSALIELKEDVLELTAKEKTKAAFSITYLEDMAKAGSRLADVVTLEVATDMPLKIDFTVEQGKLVYYAAPRIEID